MERVWSVGSGVGWSSGGCGKAEVEEGGVDRGGGVVHPISGWGSGVVSMLDAAVVVAVPVLLHGVSRSLWSPSLGPWVPSMQRHAREMQNNAERVSSTQSLALNRLVRPLSVPEASPPLVP